MPKNGLVRRSSRDKQLDNASCKTTAPSKTVSRSSSYYQLDINYDPCNEYLRLQLQPFETRESILEEHNAIEHCVMTGNPLSVTGKSKNKSQQENGPIYLNYYSLNPLERKAKPQSNEIRKHQKTNYCELDLIPKRNADKTDRVFSTARVQTEWSIAENKGETKVCTKNKPPSRECPESSVTEEIRESKSNMRDRQKRKRKDSNSCANINSKAENASHAKSDSKQWKGTQTLSTLFTPIYPFQNSVNVRNYSRRVEEEYKEEIRKESELRKDKKRKSASSNSVKEDSKASERRITKEESRLNAENENDNTSKTHHEKKKYSRKKKSSTSSLLPEQTSVNNETELHHENGVKQKLSSDRNRRKHESPTRILSTTNVEEQVAKNRRTKRKMREAVNAEDFDIDEELLTKVSTRILKSDKIRATLQSNSDEKQVYFILVASDVIKRKGSKTKKRESGDVLKETKSQDSAKERSVKKRYKECYDAEQQKKTEIKRDSECSNKQCDKRKNSNEKIGKKREVRRSSSTSYAESLETSVGVNQIDNHTRYRVSPDGNLKEHSQLAIGSQAKVSEKEKTKSTKDRKGNCEVGQVTNSKKHNVSAMPTYDSNIASQSGKLYASLASIDHSGDFEVKKKSYQKHPKQALHALGSIGDCADIKKNGFIIANCSSFDIDSPYEKESAVFKVRSKTKKKKAKLNYSDSDCTYQRREARTKLKSDKSRTEYVQRESSSNNSKRKCLSRGHSTCSLFKPKMSSKSAETDQFFLGHADATKSVFRHQSSSSISRKATTANGQFLHPEISFSQLNLQPVVAYYSSPSKILDLRCSATNASQKQRLLVINNPPEEPLYGSGTENSDKVAHSVIVTNKENEQDNLIRYFATPRKHNHPKSNHRPRNLVCTENVIETVRKPSANASNTIGFVVEGIEPPKRIGFAEDNRSHNISAKLTNLHKTVFSVIEIKSTAPIRGVECFVEKVNDHDLKEKEVTKETIQLEICKTDLSECEPVHNITNVCASKEPQKPKTKVRQKVILPRLKNEALTKRQMEPVNTDNQNNKIKTPNTRTGRCSKLSVGSDPIKNNRCMLPKSATNPRVTKCSKSSVGSQSMKNVSCLPCKPVLKKRTESVLQSKSKNESQKLALQVSGTKKILMKQNGSDKIKTLPSNNAFNKQKFAIIKDVDTLDHITEESQSHYSTDVDKAKQISKKQGNGISFNDQIPTQIINDIKQMSSEVMDELNKLLDSNSSANPDVLSAVEKAKTISSVYAAKTIEKITLDVERSTSEKQASSESAVETLQLQACNNHDKCANKLQTPCTVDVELNNEDVEAFKCKIPEKAKPIQQRLLKREDPSSEETPDILAGKHKKRRHRPKTASSVTINNKEGGLTKSETILTKENLCSGVSSKESKKCSKKVHSPTSSECGLNVNKEKSSTNEKSSTQTCSRSPLSADTSGNSSCDKPLQNIDVLITLLKRESITCMRQLEKRLNKLLCLENVNLSSTTPTSVNEESKNNKKSPRNTQILYGFDHIKSSPVKKKLRSSCYFTKDRTGSCKLSAFQKRKIYGEYLRSLGAKHSCHSINSVCKLMLGESMQSLIERVCDGAKEGEDEEKKVKPPKQIKRRRKITVPSSNKSDFQRITDGVTSHENMLERFLLPPSKELQSIQLTDEKFSAKRKKCDAVTDTTDSSVHKSPSKKLKLENNQEPYLFIRENSTDRQMFDNRCRFAARQSSTSLLNKDGYYLGDATLDETPNSTFSRTSRRNQKYVKRLWKCKQPRSQSEKHIKKIFQLKNEVCSQSAVSLCSCYSLSKPPSQCFDVVQKKLEIEEIINQTREELENLIRYTDTRYGRTAKSCQRFLYGAKHASSTISKSFSYDQIQNIRENFNFCLKDIIQSSDTADNVYSTDSLNDTERKTSVTCKCRYDQGNKENMDPSNNGYNKYKLKDLTPTKRTNIFVYNTEVMYNKSKTNEVPRIIGNNNAQTSLLQASPGTSRCPPSSTIVSEESGYESNKSKNPVTHFFKKRSSMLDFFKTSKVQVTEISKPPRKINNEEDCKKSLYWNFIKQHSAREKEKVRKISQKGIKIIGHDIQDKAESGTSKCSTDIAVATSCSIGAQSSLTQCRSTCKYFKIRTERKSYIFPYLGTQLSTTDCRSTSLDSIERELIKLPSTNSVPNTQVSKGFMKPKRDSNGNLTWTKLKNHFKMYYAEDKSTNYHFKSIKGKRSKQTMTDKKPFFSAKMVSCCTSIENTKVYTKEMKEACTDRSCIDEENSDESFVCQQGQSTVGCACSNAPQSKVSYRPESDCTCMDNINHSFLCSEKKSLTEYKKYAENVRKEAKAKKESYLKQFNDFKEKFISAAQARKSTTEIKKEPCKCPQEVLDRLMFYQKHVNECQEYAQKVRIEAELRKEGLKKSQDFEEVPLKLLLGKALGFGKGKSQQKQASKQTLPKITLSPPTPSSSILTGSSLSKTSSSSKFSLISSEKPETSSKSLQPVIKNYGKDTKDNSILSSEASVEVSVGRSSRTELESQRSKSVESALSGVEKLSKTLEPSELSDSIAEEASKESKEDVVSVVPVESFTNKPPEIPSEVSVPAEEKPALKTKEDLESEELKKNLTDKELFDKLLESYEREEDIVEKLSQDDEFFESQLSLVKSKESVKKFLEENGTEVRAVGTTDKHQKQSKFTKLFKRKGSVNEIVSPRIERLRLESVDHTMEAVKLHQATEDVQRAIIVDVEETGNKEKVQFSKESVIFEKQYEVLEEPEPETKKKSVDSAFTEDILSLSTNKTPEIEYDDARDHSRLQAGEIGKCFRRGFRPDNMALSGDPCLNIDETEQLRRVNPEIDEDRASIIDFSERETPLEYLLGLGFSVDEASNAIRDEDVRNRLNAAITEVPIIVLFVMHFVI